MPHFTTPGYLAMGGQIIDATVVAAPRQARKCVDGPLSQAQGRPLRAHHAKANAGRSTVRSAVEHVFAAEKHRMKLFVRTVGLARVKVKIGMVNLAYNFTRLAWLKARAASA